MPQDWFSQNAPAQADWFSQNAPQPSHVPHQPSEEEWAATPTGEKMRTVLKVMGRGIAGAFMPGGDARNAVESPTMALATTLAPEALTPRVISAVGKGVSSLAPRAVQAAVKPTVTELRRQSGAAMSGLQGQANRVTGILLKNRWRNADQAAAAIKDAETKLQGALSGAEDVAIDTATRVPRYLGKLERSASRQAMPSHDVATVRSASDRVMAGPLAEDVTTSVMRPSPSGLLDEFGKPMQVPVQESSRAMRTDVNPSEGLEIARATGRWNNRKSWGELKGAEQEASKATERAVRDSVKEAVPAAKPILQRQSDALTMYPILDRMALRQGNRDLVGLPAWIGASSGGLGARSLMGMAAQFMRNQQLPLGYAAQDVGKFLMQNAGRGGTVAPNLLRAALLQTLSEAETPVPPTQ